ncbi:protein YIPF7-like isoform X2 [Notolabrus celidotus]|uniref:protein YIPF7-like isoform X2 n=1 Tax=Notolabrus celidotus TaxID=1203425 RepID=UPI00148F86AD|nr:protein YIPF7-like isoform X2 [Notolabrus celidotus]
MGDIQQFEQDFYQTRYYIDDQGQTVAYYDNYDSTNPAYYDNGAQTFMPEVLDPSMQQDYTGQYYQPGTLGDTGAESPEEEPPLLEELGINFDHIWQKTLTVLNPLKPADGSIMNETDLTGPIIFCIALGVTLMMAGKAHFGYVYGTSATGCTGMYMLLSLMSSLAVSFGCVASVLGYCLLPMVALSAFAVFYSLQTSWRRSSVQSQGIITAVTLTEGLHGDCFYFLTPPLTPCFQLQPLASSVKQ